MRTIRGLRWWMIGLVMLGSIVNYLTRSTLGVAAPVLLQDLHITEKQYSWITGAFQGAIMLRPICGYALDILGLKVGFAIFATDAAIGKHLRVVSNLTDQAGTITAPIPLPRNAPLRLRIEVDYERLLFAYRLGGENWRWLPEQFDASIVSDEAGPPGMPNFTGAFVGMCCQDMAGLCRAADFDDFEYRERDFEANVGEPRQRHI